MQFTGNRSRRKSKITKLEGTENGGKYLHGLQMYKIPPTDNITLEEFEEFAIDRLKGKNVSYLTLILERWMVHNSAL